MKENRSAAGRMWNLYRQGGLTSAWAAATGDQNAHHMALIRALMKKQRHEAQLSTSLKDLELVIFDLETTGFSPKQGDEILSIGAVKVTGLHIEEAENFYTLINPNRDIPTSIQQLTGITEEMVQSSPFIIEGLRNFLDFVGKRVLVAHGSGHDKQFLNEALWKTSRTRLTHRVMDTMMVAKWLHPNEDHYGLDELIQLYDIADIGRHHALHDAQMTAQLWIKFVQQMLNRKVHTLGELYAHLSR
ncbi:exonuclease domain-containing protein [Longirhabdus pacifica]|uniref:exonuclease domain-containing protein n=1 Tax=Longirhabdus pacifica TaxID=2305227 RepID=UPI0010093BC0|nr:exonuclease domain-containing protein [Longirhabdus pacifica]